MTSEQPIKDSFINNSLYPLQSVQDIMDARNPRHTLPNAPAQGLMLYKIKYGPSIHP